MMQYQNQGCYRIDDDRTLCCNTKIKTHYARQHLHLLMTNWARIIRDVSSLNRIDQCIGSCVFALSDESRVLLYIWWTCFAEWTAQLSEMALIGDSCSAVHVVPDRFELSPGLFHKRNCSNRWQPGSRSGLLRVRFFVQFNLEVEASGALRH